MKFCTSLTLLFIAFLINALPGFGQEDLKISVTASHINADPGDEITYVIKYMNAGLTTASDVIITSQLPDMETYTYVSSNPQGVVLGNEITWNQSQIPELALLSNGERQITVTVKAGIPGSGDSQYSSGYYIPSATAILNSYATIKSNSTVIPLHSNTVSTTIVQNYSVHINNASGVIKSATGTTIYYMIQVSNNGNVYDRYDLSSLNYDCDGPGGKDYDKLSASFTDLNGNTITKTDWIEPDQAYFFLLKLTAPKGTNPGKWSCHDVIATSSASGYSGVGKIQTQTDGAPHYPLVSLSKIDDKDPVEAGELLNYTIYAFNSNDTYAANNFIIKETYPPNVSFVSSTPAPDPGGDNQWSLGNLEYGLAGAKTINITLRVNSLSNCGGIITNTVSASYDGCDASNPPQATVVTTIKSYPDLVISKTAKLSSTPARKGESITYTLSYQNIGSCDAPNSLIKDLFDEVHTNIVNAGGGTQSGSEISWTLGTLTPGQSGSITYSALIDPGSKFNPGTTIITNKAIISTSENESNLNNNTSIATIPVSVLPDMKVEVLSEKMIMEPGKQNTYTLKISNIGDIAASNVEIKNQLPTGLNVGFISDGGINLDGFIAWPVISTFEVGSSVEYQVKITPSCSFIPSITSITTVTSSIIDKDESNNSVTVHSVVQDITEPVLADIPTDMTTGCENIPAVGTPKASDNCDSTPVIHYLGEVSTRGTDPLLPDYYNYTLTRSWDASDASGNHSMPGTQVITVKDIVPPLMPVLQDVTVGECSGTPTAPTTTDICKGTLIGTPSTVFPITQQGTTVVTWTFDDGNGNVTTANQNVIVDDVTHPVPDMASLPDATGECSVTVTAPTATDNCKGKITATTTDPFTYSAQGTYTIHWTYDDGNGNTSSQTQTVVVDDVTAPVADITDLPVITGECSATITAPTSTDNCKGKITATTTDPLTYSAQGTYT
ncbi:MAG TPA: hypothetical protein VK205_12425, partial [Prolixibacteraceae bacterium]|nr:hypothetical protein [Prolixibacteraceae bacterium]